MTQTQIIWTLRKRTIQIATQIIEACHKARKAEEHDHTEETQTRIIGQNKILLDVLSGIKGGEDISSRPTRIATGEQIVEMAQELEKILKRNTGKDADEACIRAIYRLSMSQQRPVQHSKWRAEAVVTLMDFTGATNEEINNWIETARKMAQIEKP